MESTKPTIGGLQIGIILLTLATAAMHLALIFPDFLFILNALGYVGLLGALYLPIPGLARYRGIIRWALMGYTLLTIFGLAGHRSARSVCLHQQADRGGADHPAMAGKSSATMRLSVRRKWHRLRP